MQKSEQKKNYFRRKKYDHKNDVNKEVPVESIRLIPLGGLNEIGKNMTVYECMGDMFIVDCGNTFPDSEMFGVDLVIPDFSYVVENKEKSCLIHKRFASFYPVSELYYNYYWWIKESYRTLKDDGLFIVKCMSTVSGGYQHNSEEFVFMTAMNMGFYCVDKFILQSKARLVSSSKYKKQCHARKYTSVFYVFQKSPKMLNKYNYFNLIQEMNNSNLEGMEWELK